MVKCAKAFYQMTLCCWLNRPDMHMLQHAMDAEKMLVYLNTKQIKENGLEHLVK